MSNRLAQETSPYLLQHKDNPVDWYPWTDEAFQKARDEKKLIFLSIGYSSCHWCHVMEHESFDDQATADWLNEHFVCIKVDREERPDLDAVYMEAVQMMTGHGGWPLSAWLLPDGIPIYGGTYFPPEDRQGFPGFLTVCKRIQHLYKNEPEQFSQRTDEIRQAINRDVVDNLNPSGITENDLKSVTATIGKMFDSTNGGFSGEPKFPMAMVIRYLNRWHLYSGEEKSKDMATHSLRQMVRGGIHDHVGGGFARYSTDAQWLVPHFEKMLYDNALLLPELCEACLLDEDEDFLRAANGIVRWLKREMTSKEGGFYSALDADSEGEEGKFYVWKKSEIEEILKDDDELNLFVDAFDISDSGNWEGKNIPNRTASDDMIAEIHGFSLSDLYQKFDEIFEKLYAEREKRVRPLCDDKVITSWNAMMSIGLMRSWLLTGNDEFRDLAFNNVDFLLENHLSEDTLFRISRNGQIKQPGFLDDYALFITALALRFQCSGEEQFLIWADDLTKIMITDFFDEEKQAFRYTNNQHEKLIMEQRDVFDNATPSGNSAAVEALILVGRLTGKDQYTKLGYKICEQFSELAIKHPTSFGYLINSYLQYINPGREIIINGSDTEDFLISWRSHRKPGDILVIGEKLELLSYPTFQGKKKTDNQTTAFVCENFTCKQPVTKLDEFENLL